MVRTAPSGRASIKRIGRWTGTEGEFLVLHDESAALGAILDKAVTAKVKGETTTIKLPEVSSVEVRVEGGEIVIKPRKEDNDVIKAVRSTRWDAARGAYAVSTRYAKSVAKALEEIKGREEQRATSAIEQRQAAAERSDRVASILRERLAGSKVALHAGHGRVQFVFPYDAGLVATVRALPGAQFDRVTKRWDTYARTEADAERIVVAAAHLAERLPAIAEARAASTAEAERVRAA